MGRNPHLEIERGSGEMLFNPEPSDEVHPGDILVAMGKEADIRNLEQACVVAG